MKKVQVVFDIGNTNQKFAVFHHSEIIEKHTQPSFSITELEHLFSRYQVSGLIMSNVGQLSPEIKTYFQSIEGSLFLNENTLLPIHNNYKTPETLGSDRIACAAAAAFLFPKTNCLIIDAGTCIKYDFIDADRMYLGGAIAPGISMRFKALHNYTAALPFLKPDMQNIQWLETTGETTEQSLLSGVLKAVLYEATGFIQYYQDKYENILVITTGGDSVFFELHLKTKIFALPNLSLTGLHQILLHNQKIH